jgi:hypothetical protein
MSHNLGTVAIFRLLGSEFEFRITIRIRVRVRVRFKIQKNTKLQKSKYSNSSSNVTGIREWSLFMGRGVW